MVLTFAYNRHFRSLPQTIHPPRRRRLRPVRRLPPLFPQIPRLSTRKCMVFHAFPLPSTELPFHRTYPLSMLRSLLALLLLAQTASAAIDLTPLEQIPVRDPDTGRDKPFFVFAEESLLAVTGKTSLTVDGKYRNAM